MTDPGVYAGYLAVAGELVLIGKQPDGDSVRFRPAEPALLAGLDHAERLHPSADGTVQLRFDGVDAPELHYGAQEQPLGAESRDALLAHLGFTDIAYQADGSTVTAATPATLPAVVLSRLVELNGRPVAFVFTAGTGAPATGERMALSEGLLAASANSWLLATGAAYPLAYTSTDAVIRDALRSTAAGARAAALGVWAADTSAGFPVTDQQALGPGGALVHPKLFRRATDYLRDRGTGVDLTLPEWLAARPEQDDAVLVAGADPVPLHTLLIQQGDTVTLLPDLLDLVFLER